MDIDKSLEFFQKYKIQFDSLKKLDISESDTRSKILDVIFKDLLGWQEEDIRREEYLKDTGFFDYILSTGQFAFIVEAKKTLVKLKLPNTKRVKLKTLLTDPNNKEVIKQIRGYLVEKGLLLGVISNGHQFIVSQFININGEPWEDNYAIIFNGFEDIEKRFINFYELLSRELIVKKGRIEIKKEIRFSKKLISNSSLLRRNEKLIRNELSDKLIQIIDVIFREINNTVGLENMNTLKDCYVFNKDVEKHHSEMSVMFEDSPPKYDERISAVRNTVNTQSAIEEKLLEDPLNLPNPIVLIGGKGSGKTTFINYFFKISLSEKSKKKIPNVYIDFRAFSSSQIRNSSFIYQRILDILYDTVPDLNLKNYKILKRIYKKEIKLNSEDGLWSIYKDRPEILEDKINQFIEKKISNRDCKLNSV